MIASHLSPAGRTAMLPQLQSSRAVTSTAGSRSPWRHQQTRGIRLEFWSWNLQQPGSRGHQACHKVSKSAYIEALNRKLLRNRHHRLHISNSSMKSFMCSAFHENKTRVNLQELKNDATRTASNLARATSGSINTSRKATTDRHSARTPTNDGTQLLNQKYEIDPITNRKVFKQDSSTLSAQTDSPASTIPIENFYEHGPPVSQFPSPQTLPKQSATTAPDGLAATASQSKGTYVTDSELYRDGRTVEQELGVYTPFQHNEPDGHFPPPPDPVEQALSNGRPLAEELGIYTPFRYNEPDGHFPPPPDPVEQALSNGRPLEEELGIYKPFRYNEPDGHFPPPPDPVEQALNNGRSLKEELGIYKAFRHNEPDGHPPVSGESSGKSLGNRRLLADELGVYKPFRYNEPDGHYAPPPDAVDKALNEFDQKWDPEIKAYRAFRYNEPDGHIPPPPKPVDQALDGLDKNLDPELDAYTAFRHNEPDGHFPPPPDPVEQGLNAFDQKWDPELDAYVPFRHNEPDGHPPVSGDSSGKTLGNRRQLADELGVYKPFRHNEPDGHFPPPADPVEQGLNAFDQKWDPELDAYVPFRHNEPDGHFPPPADPVEQSLNEFDQKWDPELDAYVPYRHNEPDGHFPPPADPVNKALNEFDQKWEPRLENDNFFFDEDFDAQRSAQLAPNTAKQTSSSNQEKDLSSKIIKSSRKESKKEKQARRRKMEEDFEASSTEFSKDIEAVSKSDKIRAARERAQEFEIERSELLNHQGHLRGKVEARLREIAELDQREAGRIPVSESLRDPVEQDQATSSATDGGPEPFVFVSSYGADLPAAAKAVQGSKGKKANAKNDKGDKLKASLVNELRSIYQDAYGAIETQHRQPVGQLSPKEIASKDQSAENGDGVTAQNPTVYKILAYSPETQSVLITETTSVVPPGNRKPLSPAAVLPRLKNPARFLPHIAPLLNEGYEIASGDGHVLVFRKVRDGPPLGIPAAKTETDTQARKMTNPIDGMQSIRPATGNFASPTGFVNHDLPEYHIKSGTETGQDGQNYDGSESSWKDQEWHDRAARRQKGKKKVKRLLIGAVWVGGLSYAVGVVAEFFRTGGTEGKGAVGL
ncbi:hypothetical protein VE03_05160 [Pseudogymnoascus sp. 23342-1-I1]|nr:hypothetical protein VE03_05160 [Pseudogymnoascus sp. 23342-1-I1]